MSHRDQISTLPDDPVRTLVAGGAYGAAAWSVGYLVSLALFRGIQLGPGTVPDLEQAWVLREVPGWALSAYVFYGGHLVSVVFPAGRPTYFNLALGLGGSTTLVALSVPVLTLTAAGLLHARRRTPASVSRARVYGASIALGYALLMVAGAVLFEYTVHTDEDVARAVVVHLPQAAVLGIVYPAVLGALGGSLARADVAEFLGEFP